MCEKLFAELLNQDPTLQALYNTYGVPKLRTKYTGFWGLVRIVNAQLISTAAAHTIMDRLTLLIPDKTAKAWLQTNPDNIRKTGMGKNKISALTMVANDIQNGGLNLDTLATQGTQAIHNTLTQYKYIGNWSANAYALTHNTDVFLYDDLGVRDGMQIALNLPKRPSSQFCKAHYKKYWYPHGTAATHFMWHIKH